MNYDNKTKEELIKELQELQQENVFLKATFDKSFNELTLAENKFRMLFEQSIVGMALVSHETGRFLEVNSSVLEATGYSKEEFLNLSYWEITPKKYEAQEKKQLQDLNETGHFGPNLKEYTRKDGTLYPISISGTIFVDTNGKKVVWGIIEDITERKKVERKIQKQNNELQKLNTNKDLFITILAHDLINPFNSILGLLSILNDNIRDYDIDKIEKLINLINHSAQNTFNLLEDILIWVRANSDEMPYEPENLNFTLICKEIIENLKLTATAKRITINYLSTDEINIFADKNMLNTVLRNIISNSIKFTNKNGRIDIFTETNHTNLIITVSDNGIGIEPNTLNKLFDISQKISTNGTENEKGTGFGLLLCKEFVENTTEIFG